MKSLLVAAAGACLAAAASAEVSAERGEYLVRGPMGCGNCHTPLGPAGPILEQELAGRLVEETEMFTAYAPNLTAAGPSAAWTDEELGRAIREGIRPDGSVIGPPMPFPEYRHISDDDLASIVAYLRTLPAVENEVPESTYNMPLPPAYGPPVESVAATEPGVTEAYGEYLVTIAHCMACHSPMGPQGPMSDPAGGHMGQGGAEFAGPWGVSIAPNITSGEDGLAEYSDDELKAMITQGIRPDGTQMLPPMPYGHLALMTADDLDAVVLYLRTVPALPDAE